MIGAAACAGGHTPEHAGSRRRRRGAAWRRCGLTGTGPLVVCAWLLWHTALVGAGAAAGCAHTRKRLRGMAGLLEAAVCEYGRDSSGEDELRVGVGGQTPDSPQHVAAAFAHLKKVCEGLPPEQAAAAGGAVAPAESATKKRRVHAPEASASAGGGGQAPPQHESAPQVSADGRVRSFPHVEGNYAGFVYVPLRGIEGLEAASVAATKIAQEALNKKWTEGGPGRDQCLLHRIPVQDLHISVSRTFALRRVQIKPIVDDLRRTLNALPCFDAAVSGIDLYSNDDRTRSFVGLSLSVGAARMQTTTRAVDYALSTVDVAPFYEEMRFHVSVAWFAGTVPAGVPLILVGDDWVRGSGEAGCCKGKPGDESHKARLRVSFSVEAVEAKIGAKKYAFKLKKG